LLLDVERNQRTAEAIQNTYTYHVHRVQQDMNKDGSVKKTTVTDSDSFSVDGVRVNRVTAVNGKPLSASEAQKESEKVDKEVAKGRDHRAKEDAQGHETNARGDDEISASRILELGKFTNPRREMLNGRSTIVVDYAGDPQAKTHSTTEAIFRDLLGTVWIDEADRTMVRAEGRFANDFKIGGGLLADIHKGLNFSFRATKVNDETWLPAEIEGRGSARALLFFNFNGALTVTTSDYRKFRSSAQIVEGTASKVDSEGNPVVDPTPVTPPPMPPTASPPK
jgi:hypothetical protein